MNTSETNDMMRWSHAAPGAPLYLGQGNRPKWRATSTITLPELPPPSTEAEKILITGRLATPSSRTKKPGPPLQFSHVPPRGLDLTESFLDSHRMPGTTRSSTVAYSIVFHAFLLSAALLVPMWFADTLDIRTFTRTMLVAPPPPPAPAAPSVAVRALANSAPHRQITVKGQLLLPTYIPKQVAMVNEPQVGPEVSGGVLGGVEGGIPGGVFGGTLSVGLTVPAIPAPPTPAPAAAPKGPVRVGGNVKPPRILQQVDPVYPFLAHKVGFEGDVVISAIIDAQGDVTEMKLVSGHPLLIEAAMNALRHWKFEPTMLDGEAVAISWEITIHFRLS